MDESIELDDWSGAVRLRRDGIIVRRWEHPDDVSFDDVPERLWPDLEAFRDDARDWFDPGAEARHAHDTSRGCP